MKKLLGAVIMAAVALGTFVAINISDWGMNRRIDRTLSRANQSLLNDGKLHVFLCGTAAALPDEKRAGPCTAVIAGGEFLLIDVGPSAWRNVDLMNLPVGKLSAVLVTHFHSDHIGEVGEAITQSWIAGRRQPLDIFGPPGIQQIVNGFRMVYAQDVTYRVAHHGEEHMPESGSHATAHAFPMPQGTAAVKVLERNGVRISAFAVQHAPVHPAVGYRIEYAGRVVVVSGDTTKTTATIENARGADLLLHEALAAHLTDRASRRAKETGLGRFAKLAADVRDYHTTPVEAAEVARQAGVTELVLTHIFPPLPNFAARRMFLRGANDAFTGKITLGEDRMRFDLDPLTQAPR